ncbi:MAG: hypothetical protein ABUS54_03530, partial [Actinomycetota bacterium]
LARPARDLREGERRDEGLWTWTGRVEGRADALCVYLECGSVVALLDPVVPPEDPERFLRALDRDVERFGGGVRIALTETGKSDAAAELAERYGAPVWRPGDAEPLPDGLVPLRVDAARVVFWIEAHATLFSGEVAVRVVPGSKP